MISSVSPSHVSHRAIYVLNKFTINGKSFDDESERVDVDDNEEVEEQLIKEEHDEDKGEDGDGNDNDEIEDLLERTIADEDIDVEIVFFLLLTLAVDRHFIPFLHFFFWGLRGSILAISCFFFWGFKIREEFGTILVFGIWLHEESHEGFFKSENGSIVSEMKGESDGDTS